MHLTRLARLLPPLCCAGLLATGALAQDAKPGVQADGTVTAPAASVPYSMFASPQARAFFPQMLAEEAKAPPISAPIDASRAFYDRMNSARVARMQKLYPVRTRRGTIAGVGVDVVLPAQGVAPANRRRVLLNLHGGAFLWGAHSGALVESIPIASLGRIEVIAVDYRMGPEHVFPAASEDVEKVYRALLKTHRPEQIGIYGCSPAAHSPARRWRASSPTGCRCPAPSASSAAASPSLAATRPTWRRCSTAKACRRIRCAWPTFPTSAAPTRATRW